MTINDSWKPTSNKYAGLYIKIIVATNINSAILSASLSISFPINAKVNINAALSTGGPSPVISV